MNDQVWPTPFSLVPFGAVRASVAGLKRVLDDQESALIRIAIEDALSAGALGVSLGLVYPPNDAATESELIAALQPLAGSSHILAVHVRSQANYWIEAIEEALRLAAGIRCRLLISHLCIGGGRNQWKAKWVLARLLRARDEGMDVWFDQHPYSAGSTSLTQLLPPWTLRSGPSGVELDVAPDDLAQLLEVPSVSAGWENYVELIGPENILIAGSIRPVDFIGKTLADMRDEWNVSLAGTLVRILEMTEGSSTIVLLNLYEPDTIALIAETEFGCFSTDSVHSACPHPRLYGTYPYAFHQLVGAGRLTESEFVRRSAQIPTEIMRFSRKAEINKGGEADFLIVDSGQLNHSADYLNPSNPVSGIRALILGGELVS
jgi:N-acyl-D-amino-acid deacylase